MILIDTHAHLTHPQFDLDLKRVIQQADQAGVSKIIAIGDSLQTSQQAIKLANNNPNIYAVIGIHPFELTHAPLAKLLKDLQALKPLVRHPKVVAIGECGLDTTYPFKQSPNDALQDQQTLLKTQIEWANQVHMPMIIHQRQAEDALTQLMLKTRPHQAVWHCFTGNEKLLEQWLNWGFSISLTGLITYPKNQSLSQIIANIPRDKVMLETDSPFLPPQSHRGQRCEPKYLIETAQELAKIYQLPLQVVANQTSLNAANFFALK